MPENGALDDVKGVARGLYEKLIGVKPEPADPGVAAIDTGSGAVARTEAAIARLAGGAAGLTDPSGSSPRARPARTTLRPSTSSTAPRPAGRLSSSSGRGSLAAAVGLASAGMRATAFLSGPELVAAADAAGLRRRTGVCPWSSTWTTGQPARGRLPGRARGRTAPAPSCCWPATSRRRST